MPITVQSTKKRCASRRCASCCPFASTLTDSWCNWMEASLRAMN